SLLPELSSKVLRSQANVPIENRSTIEHAANIARNLYSNIQSQSIHTNNQVNNGYPTRQPKNKNKSA
ncbi:hypothetical protein DFQ30_001433, partial [Apophysomyces sp. BC1015]